MNGDTRGMQQLTYREAVREAIREALHKDERVFLMGEDVGRSCPVWVPTWKPAHSWSGLCNPAITSSAAISSL
jgi:hypothetical protein